VKSEGFMEVTISNNTFWCGRSVVWPQTTRFRTTEGSVLLTQNNILEVLKTNIIDRFRIYVATQENS
jgi:hypothetical protein